MRQPVPLITDDDIMRLEDQIATVAASDRPRTGAPAVLRAPAAPPEEESQDSDPPIPAFLLRKDPEDGLSEAEPERDEHRGHLLGTPSRVQWLRPENPYHVAWLIPAVSLLTGGLLGRDEIWIGWLAAPMLIWLAFVIVGAVERSMAVWSGMFQALTVVQALTTTAVTIDWIGRGMPAPGMVELVSFAALPVLIAGTVAAGRMR